MTATAARRAVGGLVAAVAVLGTVVAGPATGRAAAGPGYPAFVALRDVAPTIIEEIRYAGRHNFVGRRIPGYLAPRCILTRQAAYALRAAQRRVFRQGYTLKVYDCYRPQRAVDHFVRWAKNPHDQRMRTEFYPNVDKSRLFDEGYIAEKSGHSRGSTVDLTLVKLPPRHQRPYRPGEPLVPCVAPAGERFPDNSVDMGTGYDCFDPLSHTDDPRVSDEVRRNRDLLRGTLGAAGFTNLPQEWWHFTLRDEPFPTTYFDFPITPRRHLAR